MNKRKHKSENNEYIKEVITNMIDEGSENVTTLSKEVEAKYEAIGEKTPNN